MHDIILSCSYGVAYKRFPVSQGRMQWRDFVATVVNLRYVIQGTMRMRFEKIYERPPRFNLQFKANIRGSPVSQFRVECSEHRLSLCGFQNITDRRTSVPLTVCVGPARQLVSQSCAPLLADQ